MRGIRVRVTAITVMAPEQTEVTMYVRYSQGKAMSMKPTMRKN